jgi:hypothetical protein
MAFQYSTDEKAFNYAPGGICLGVCKTHLSIKPTCTCEDYFAATLSSSERVAKTVKTKRVCKVLLAQIEDMYSLTSQGAIRNYGLFKYGTLMDPHKSCDNHVCCIIVVEEP